MATATRPATDTASNGATPPTARKINFAGMGKAVPGGTYEARFDDFVYQESKPNPAKNEPGGKPMYRMIFLIADEEHPEIENRKLSRYFVVEGNALYYFFEALVALGADPEELVPEGMDESDDGLEIEPILANLRGAHCWIKVSEGEYNGRPSNAIDEIISLKAD